MKDKILQNRYKITEYIGCGGMAEVYRATDMLLERDVAIKILRSQFSADENFINKFKREAQSAAALTDSNIVSIFDIGQQDGIYYIVMEYVAGSTLQKLINKNGALPVHEAVFIAKGIAQALHKAHTKGIVHCDIKPHNILLDEKRYPKVSDFGIARAISSTTMTFDGAILGSVHYLSPEQAKGGAVTFSSDIYSLGVVMFEMLTGKLPFTGETPIAVAMQHVQATPPLLREFDVDIPAFLEVFVNKALAKNPDDRYATVEDFLNSLEIVETYLQNNMDMTMNDATSLIDIVKDDILTPKEQLLTKAKKIWQRKFGKSIVFCVLLIVGFWVGSYIAFGNFWLAGEVKVPNIVGKDRAEAIALLQKSNLEAMVIEEYENNVPIGFIIRQEPPQGTVVKEYRKISIFLSKGPELVDVPNLVGRDINTAYAELSKIFLRVGKIDEKEDKDKPDGTIISQNPNPPAHIGINSYVDFVVSTQKVKFFVMPDLTGFTTTEVRAKLTELQLKLNDIQDQHTDKYPSGTVVGQSPSPGQETSEGSEIVIVVARSLNEQTKQGIVEFIVPADSNSQQVKIIVTDNRSRRTVYENANSPGARIRQTIEGVGPMRVQFYSNGRLVEEKFI